MIWLKPIALDTAANRARSGSDATCETSLPAAVEHGSLISAIRFSVLVGQAPGLAGAEAGKGVEEAVGVDASGEADERVDGCEHERAREGVFP